MKTIAFDKVKGRLSEIIDRAGDEPIVITRYGKERAVLISAESFREREGLCANLTRWRQTNTDLFLDFTFENARQNDDTRAFE
ncbi:MAG: type II toxin-antitoxin system Phd/YefM family antitoxin [Helicobacteraceae bacterium]|jgi:prevent-host-death family protein|nr:type II toxin-antitoxin system Phd/YefM family antitoxin [Helicobacteraceae bacterium]